MREENEGFWFGLLFCWWSGMIVFWGMWSELGETWFHWWMKVIVGSEGVCCLWGGIEFDCFEQGVWMDEWFVEWPSHWPDMRWMKWFLTTLHSPSTSIHEWLWCCVDEWITSKHPDKQGIWRGCDWGRENHEWRKTTECGVEGQIEGEWWMRLERPSEQISSDWIWMEFCCWCVWHERNGGWTFIKTSVEWGVERTTIPPQLFCGFQSCYLFTFTVLFHSYKQWNTSPHELNLRCCLGGLVLGWEWNLKQPFQTCLNLPNDNMNILNIDMETSLSHFITPTGQSLYHHNQYSLTFFPSRLLKPIMVISSYIKKDNSQTISFLFIPYKQCHFIPKTRFQTLQRLFESDGVVVLFHKGTIWTCYDWVILPLLISSLSFPHFLIHNTHPTMSFGWNNPGLSHISHSPTSSQHTFFNHSLGMNG